jgi:hypothetical protein
MNFVFTMVNFLSVIIKQNVTFGNNSVFQLFVLSLTVAELNTPFVFRKMMSAVQNIGSSPASLLY